MISLTPKRLVQYLDKYYGYTIAEDAANKILTQCEDKFDNIFNEDELLEIVEDYLI